MSLGTQSSVSTLPPIINQVKAPPQSSPSLLPGGTRSSRPDGSKDALIDQTQKAQLMRVNAPFSSQKITVDLPTSDKENPKKVLYTVQFFKQMNLAIANPLFPSIRAATPLANNTDTLIIPDIEKALEKKVNEFNDLNLSDFFVYSEKKLCSEKKPEMYFKYLLPMITLYESCSLEQYQRINDFLRPIWIFNELTAKNLFETDEMKAYINCIIHDSGPDEFIRKFGHTLTARFSTHQKDQGVISFDNIKSKLTQNIKEMAVVFKSTLQFSPATDSFSDVSGSTDGSDDFNHFETDINDYINIDYPNYTDPNENSNKLSDAACLFLDFFKGCIYEKSNENSEHRINSGGCKLMVRAVASILGLSSTNALVDNLTFNSNADNIEIGQQLKQHLKELLTLQGEANVVFNDAISLNKEFTKGERTFESIQKNEYKDKQPEEWFELKMKNYQTIINRYSAKVSQTLHLISAHYDQTPALVELHRYINLNSAALSGVPLWSCNLTNRYFFLGIKTLEDLKTIIHGFQKNQMELQPLVEK